MHSEKGRLEEKTNKGGGVYESKVEIIYTHTYINGCPVRFGRLKLFSSLIQASEVRGGRGAGRNLKEISGREARGARRCNAACSLTSLS